MAYQIDFFPVGEGSRSGDAIAMRFGDFSDHMKTQVVVIDGGSRVRGKRWSSTFAKCMAQRTWISSSRHIPTATIRLDSRP
jgi:hypothetical protein